MALFGDDDEFVVEEMKELEEEEEEEEGHVEPSNPAQSATAHPATLKSTVIASKPFTTNEASVDEGSVVARTWPFLP